MRLIDNDIDLISTILSDFLNSLATAQEADFLALNTPLFCPDGELIQKLSASPSTMLKQAWQKQINRSGVYQLSLNEAERAVTVTPAMTAMAIVTYIFLKNYLTTRQDREQMAPLDYSLQLCQTIPAATNHVDAIIYDSLIEPCCKLRRQISANAESKSPLLSALLRTNPLSELKNLDLVLPEPLKSLADNYIVPQQKYKDKNDQPAAKIETEKDYQQWWLQSENFILTPRLKHLLRDQWLTIPENSLSCMGLGIFFEELRRRGKRLFRTPILEFFEAYDYLQRHQAQIEKKNSQNSNIPYQKLTIIRNLLESKNRDHNRKGNQYFLKFRALLEIIAEEQAIPQDFRHLSREFCLQRLAPLSTLATVIGGQRTPLNPTFGAIQFSDQGAK